MNAGAGIIQLKTSDDLCARRYIHYCLVILLTGGQGSCRVEGLEYFLTFPFLSECLLLLFHCVTLKWSRRNRMKLIFELTCHR